MLPVKKFPFSENFENSTVSLTSFTFRGDFYLQKDFCTSNQQNGKKRQLKIQGKEAGAESDGDENECRSGHHQEGERTDQPPGASPLLPGVPEERREPEDRGAQGDRAGHRDPGLDHGPAGEEHEGSLHPVRVGIQPRDQALRADGGRRLVPAGQGGGHQQTCRVFPLQVKIFPTHCPL